MPNRDGTGPSGKGARTGRGIGPCGNNTPKGEMRGYGLGLGFRRNQTNTSSNVNET